MDRESIRKRMAQMEKVQGELKAAKEMIRSELESSPEFMEAAEEAKASAAKKKRLRDEILGKGPNEKLVAEIKSDNEEIAALKQILSAELMAVYKESETDEIEDHNGVSRKFEFYFKLLPKGAKGSERDYYGKRDDI